MSCPFFPRARRLHGVAAVFALLLCADGLTHDHGHAQHGPHVHGEAQMQLVLEGRDLAIDVVVPGASAVGFERQARDAAEIRHLAQALDYFSNPAWLVPSPAAGCRPLRPVVDGSAFDPERKGGRSGHADLTAAYRFVCADPARLTELRVAVFERLPALERIRLAYVVGDTQGETVLTPRARSARLAP